MQNRYSPPSEWIKSVITQELLGDIYMVQLNCYGNRDDRYYKKDEFISYIIYDYIEFILIKKYNNLNFEFLNVFLKKIHEMKKFNLDEELLLIEFKSKVLNG